MVIENNTIDDGNPAYSSKELKTYIDNNIKHVQKNITRHEQEISDIRHAIDMHVKTSEITIPGMVKTAVKESLTDVESNIENKVMQSTKIYVSGWMMAAMGSLIAVLCGTLITIVVKL